jgi:type II secretory pathway component PulF
MVINNETKRDPVADKQQIKSKGQTQRGVSTAPQRAQAQGKLRRRRI